MRMLRGPAGLALLALVAWAEGRALAQPAPSLPTPPGPVAPPPLPVLRLGALLPLSGPGTWFGTEIRRGLELAASELGSRPAAGSARPGGAPPSAGARTPGEAGDREPTAPRGAPPEREPGQARDTEGPEPPPSASPPADPIEGPGQRRAVRLAVQVEDVQPLDVAAARGALGRLLAAGAAAIVTASPTPTLAIQPLAASRSVLVLHAGLPSDRGPAPGRLLLQLRAPATLRAEHLAAYAWTQGIRRLALLADGDDVGRAVRTTVGTRWRERGGALVHDENLTPEASDLRTRLRALVRAAPEALVLGYQGAALGEMARAVRAAGYAGPLLAADDGRVALLAAGAALDGARLLGDAFVAEPGTRGERFARAYVARYRTEPSRFAASAYEAAVLLADAATHALGQGRDLTGARLREALGPPQRFPSLYAGEVAVRDDGVLVRPLALFRVERGQTAFEGYVGADGRLLTASPA
jgi:ABC-type branched-subunit amino acid transport system substrate-binding protein